MKKLILLSAVIALIFVSCKESIPEETTVLSDFTPFYRMPMVLKGKVKSLKSRTYWAEEHDGKIVKGEIITRLERDSLNYMSDFNIKINIDGIPTRIEYISYDGKINHTELDVTDGKIVGGKSFTDGKQSTYFSEEYDDSGRLIEGFSYRYGADTLISRMEASFNENGQKDEWVYYNNKNELTRKHKFIWKDANLIDQHNVYNADGSLSYTMKLEYDEDGNWKTASFEYPDEDIHYFEIKDIKFDDMGNMVSVVSYKNDTLFAINDYLIEYYQEQ